MSASRHTVFPSRDEIIAPFEGYSTGVGVRQSAPSATPALAASLVIGSVASQLGLALFRLRGGGQPLAANALARRMMCDDSRLRRILGRIGERQTAPAATDKWRCCRTAVRRYRIRIVGDTWSRRASSRSAEPASPLTNFDEAWLLVQERRNVGNSEAAPVPDPSLLTRRERDVLSVLATGATNALIARRLGLSVHTVRRHCERVFQKLSVTTRTAAAHVYWKRVTAQG